jgi:hypothetical protein
MKLDFLTARIGTILKDVGCPMTLRRQVSVPYNPHDIQDPTYEEYPCAGVLTNPAKGRKGLHYKGEPQGTESNEQIQVLLAADQLPDSVEPAAGDELIIGTKIWTIVQNSPVKPANKHILHKLALKP